MDCEHEELKAIDEHWGLTSEENRYGSMVWTFERRKYQCQKCMKIIKIERAIVKD